VKVLVYLYYGYGIKHQATSAASISDQPGMPEEAPHCTIDRWRLPYEWLVMRGHAVEDDGQIQPLDDLEGVTVKRTQEDWESRLSTTKSLAQGQCLRSENSQVQGRADVGSFVRHLRPR
jgi:hypothetical protein